MAEERTPQPFTRKGRAALTHASGPNLTSVHYCRSHKTRNGRPESSVRQLNDVHNSQLRRAGRFVCLGHVLGLVVQVGEPARAGCGAVWRQHTSDWGWCSKATAPALLKHSNSCTTSTIDAGRCAAATGAPMACKHKEGWRTCPLHTRAPCSRAPGVPQISTVRTQHMPQHVPTCSQAPWHPQPSSQARPARAMRSGAGCHPVL